MPDLVLLPGMNCTGDLWADVGLGPAITPTLDECSVAEQVGVLLNRLPERFVLVGLSLGGIVAMAMALAAPERVAGLCVMSTNAKEPTAAQRRGWQDWLDRLAAGRGADELQQDIVSVLLSDEARARPELVRRVVGMGAETGAARLGAQLELQQTRTDLRPRLPQLSMPVLVLSGQRDAICPPGFHAEIADAIPHATLSHVDGGHLLPLEQPGAVAETIDGWRRNHDLA